ncbi:MAG: hypothetical protein ACI3XN_08520, partial [Eubacteriales bacterium]
KVFGSTLFQKGSPGCRAGSPARNTGRRRSPAKSAEPQGGSSARNTDMGRRAGKPKSGSSAQTGRKAFEFTLSIKKEKEVLLKISSEYGIL